MKKSKSLKSSLVLALTCATVLPASATFASESASGDNKATAVEMGIRSGTKTTESCDKICTADDFWADLTIRFEKTDLSATQKSDRIKVLMKNITLLQTNLIQPIVADNNKWRISFAGALYDGGTFGSLTGDNSTYIHRVLDFKLRGDTDISEFLIDKNKIKFHLNGKLSAAFDGSPSLSNENVPGLNDNKTYYQYGTTVSLTKSFLNNQRINLNAIFDVNDNIQITGYYQGERLSDLLGNNYLANNANGLMIKGGAVNSSVDLKDNTVGMKFEFKDRQNIIYYANLYAGKSDVSYVVPAHSGTLTQVVNTTVTNPDGSTTVNTVTNSTEVQIPEYSNKKQINTKGISVGVKIPFGN
jgi:hypothetical protein